MKGKITLITPPDIFENESYSVLFVNLNDQDQEIVSQWLASKDINENINIYFFDNNNDVPWLLHAFARCDYKFINLDTDDQLIARISSYFLGKNNSFFKTENENLAALYQYVNQNRIINIEKFLERAFNDKIELKP